MTFFARWGEALFAPRAAMARTDGDLTPGTSAGDVVRALAVVLIAAHTRELVAAVWITVTLGVRLAMPALTAAIAETATLPLVFVLVATPVMTIAAGAGRKLGRDIDLACVAALAPALVALVASTIGRLVGLGGAGRALVLIAAFGWGAIIATHGVIVARRRAR